MANVIAEIIKELLSLTWEIIKVVIGLSIDAVLFVLAVAAFIPPWRWSYATNIVNWHRPGWFCRPFRDVKQFFSEEYCSNGPGDHQSFRSLSCSQFFIMITSCICIPMGMLSLVSPFMWRPVFDALRKYFVEGGSNRIAMFDRAERGHRREQIELEFYTSLFLCGVLTIPHIALDPFVLVALFLPTRSYTTIRRLYLTLTQPLDLSEYKDETFQLCCYSVVHACLGAVDMVVWPVGLASAVASPWRCATTCRELRKALGRHDADDFSDFENSFVNMHAQLTGLCLCTTIYLFVDIITAPFAFCALLSPIRHSKFRATLVEDGAAWCGRRPAESSAPSAKTSGNINDTDTNDTNNAIDTDTMLYGYNAEMRWHSVQFGVLALGDIFLAPILVPLVLTYYRWAPVKAHLTSSSSWGSNEYSIVTCQFIALVIDMMCAPAALLLFVTRVRWKYVGEAIDQEDWKDFGGFHLAVVTQMPLLMLDTLVLPFFLVVVLTYRSEGPLHAIKHRSVWYDNPFYFHVSVMAQVMVLLHDIILFPLVLVVLCSVYRSFEVFDSIKDAFADGNNNTDGSSQNATWRDRRRTAAAAAGVSGQRPANNNNNSNNNNGENGQEGGGVDDDDNNAYPLPSLFPTNFVRGDLWFSVISIPLDIPFFAMGLVVFVSLWRSCKLYGALKLTRERWRDDGGRFYYENYDEHSCAGIMGWCCCVCCCWMELLCCCLCACFENPDSEYLCDSEFQHRQTCMGSFRDPWGWGVRWAAEWDARLTTLTQFILLLRDAICLPFMAVVVGTFYHLPTFVGRMLALVTKPVTSESAMDVELLTFTSPFKGGPTLTANLTKRRGAASSEHIVYSDARMVVLGGDFWGTIRKHYGPLATVAMGQLPLRLRDAVDGSPAPGGVHEITQHFIDLRALNGRPPSTALNRQASDNSEEEFSPVRPDSTANTTTAAAGGGGGDDGGGGDGGVGVGEVLITKLGIALGRTKRSTLVSALNELDQNARVLIQIEALATDPNTSSSERVCLFGIAPTVGDLKLVLSAGDDVAAALPPSAVSHATRMSMLSSEDQGGLVDGFATAVLLTFAELVSDMGTLLLDFLYVVMALALCVVVPWRGIGLVVVLFERTDRWSARIAKACADYICFADESIAGHFHELGDVLSAVIKDIITEHAMALPPGEAPVAQGSVSVAAPVTGLSNFSDDAPHAGGGSDGGDDAVSVSAVSAFERTARYIKGLDTVLELGRHSLQQNDEEGSCLQSMCCTDLEGLTYDAIAEERDFNNSSRRRQWLYRDSAENFGDDPRDLRHAQQAQLNRRNRRRLIMELERDGSDLKEYTTIINGVTKRLRKTDGCEIALEYLQAYDSLNKQRAACWHIRSCLTFEQIRREVSAWPTAVSPEIVDENNSLCQLLAEKDAQLAETVERTKANLTSHIDKLWKDACSSAPKIKKRSAKWGVWHKERKLARTIVKIFMKEAAIDVCCLFVGAGMLFTPHALRFCSDAKKSGTCSPMNYGYRRVVLKHMRELMWDNIRFARLCLAVLVCCMMVWVLPEFLVGLPSHCTSCDDATIYCLGHMRWALNCLWEVICVVPFLARCYKVALSACLYVLLVPATAIADLFNCTRADPTPTTGLDEASAVELGGSLGYDGEIADVLAQQATQVALPAVSTPIAQVSTHTQVNIAVDAGGGISSGDTHGQGEGTKTLGPTKMMMAMGGIIYSPLFIFLIIRATMGTYDDTPESKHDQLSDGAVISQGTTQLIVVGFLMFVLVATSIHQYCKDSARPDATLGGLKGFRKASWSAVFTLLAAPVESVVLSALVLYFSDPASCVATAADDDGDDGGANMAVISAKLLGFGCPYDDGSGRAGALSSYEGCLTGAMVVVMVACLILALPHSCDVEIPEEQKMRVAILRSPLFIVVQGLSSSTMFTWLCVTLLRPTGCTQKAAWLTNSTYIVNTVTSSNDTIHYKTVDSEVLSTAPGLSCSPYGSGADADGGIQDMLSIALLLVYILMLAVPPEISDIGGGVDGAKNGVYGRGVRTDPSYAVTIRAFQFGACATIMSVPVLEGTVYEPSVGTIVCMVLHIFLFLYSLVYSMLPPNKPQKPTTDSAEPRRACSLICVPYLRAGGAAAVVYTCVVALGVVDLRQDYLIYGGHAAVWLITLVVAAVAHIKDQRRWEAMLAGSGVEETVQSIVSLAGVLTKPTITFNHDESFDDHGRGKTVNGSAATAHALVMTATTRARSPRELAVVVEQLEQFIPCERLTPAFLWNRHAWLHPIHANKVTSFSGVKALADDLRLAIRPPPAIATWSRPFLLRLLRTKLPRYMIYHVFSFFKDEHMMERTVSEVVQGSIIGVGGAASGIFGSTFETRTLLEHGYNICRSTAIPLRHHGRHHGGVLSVENVMAQRENDTKAEETRKLAEQTGDASAGSSLWG